ncbi:hypothetical protein A0H81_13920 [Grifola frondosa]|uniref:Uncharacterized protein n=1 Tax=Grifola frondosa TaxID=5627 RepID=A0A1C7LN81_GRIFR|nr:hypothetical protein A0H81_13920 [Grifola frondosa]
MSEFIEVRYVKARVQKDQAARHRHEEQPSTTHTPAPPPSVTTTYSSTFDLLGRWLGEDHGTGFGDITDISSLTDSMAKITSSSPHTTYEQLDPLPSKRIREVNGSDDEDPDDHYGTSPKKQRYVPTTSAPVLEPCVESTTLPVNSDARADPEPAKGNQLGVGQQDIQELGHHIARFTDALLLLQLSSLDSSMHSTLQPATAQ